MQSFAILRTNVGLTTNIKIMVSSDYKLSLESIDSNDSLSNLKFKNVPFTSESKYDNMITYFYKGLPSDLAYEIQYESDVSSMSKDYSNQYDELYQYGARNIINNKSYEEEFEYFAPLYVSPNQLPSFFIIFRVDGVGIDNITKDNFKKEILYNLKTVKIFNLLQTTSIGQWLDLNFNNNINFPISPFEMSFENLEFSKWNGIDYSKGGYVSKSLFFEDVYKSEKEIFELERIIFNGYKSNKVVFPNILNLSFLFNDQPANSDNFRKWSVNRYYGFYIHDMIKVKSESPYIPIKLKNDVIVEVNNILYHESGNPFVEEYIENKKHYVEYQGEYYEIIKFQEKGSLTLQDVRYGDVITQEYRYEYITKYKIISDIDLQGKGSELNKPSITIGSDVSTYNQLYYSDGTPYIIDEWDTADVWLIEIDGIYHNLVKKDEILTLNTDYSFSFTKNQYSYWINKSNPNYTKTVKISIENNQPPISFNIYKLNFSDIKDFDNNIIDTEYSKFEYEKKLSLTQTDESKMYMVNLDSTSNPMSYDDFIFEDKVVNIPVSSEYTANYETFKIKNNGGITDLWRKNPIYCRWGFQNSLSSNDYPYLLNNSSLFEDFNRTTNVLNPNPKRSERNLDYFYTINSSTYSYIHHSLHVEKQNENGIDDTFEFELDKYLNLGTYSYGDQSLTYSYDYFSYFFERKTQFDEYNINKNVKKYSVFNPGTKYMPNITLFRGIKFSIYDILSIKKDVSNSIIENINLKTSNFFDKYKFSILLSKNKYSVINLDNNSDVGTMTYSVNDMEWKTADEWKLNKVYDKDDYCIKDDILYKSITENNVTTTPEIAGFHIPTAPYNLTDKWDIHSENNFILWVPGRTYDTDSSYVYNNSEYYYCYNNSNNPVDFWDPTGTYSNMDKILFKGNYYESTYNNNKYRPDYRIPYKTEYVKNTLRSLIEGKDVYEYVGTCYWEKIEEPANVKWKIVEIWSPDKKYENTYIVHNNILYHTTLSEIGQTPELSSTWERQYSFVPDSDIKYNTSNNPIIYMNGLYYIIKTNTSSSTLQNGVNIYINKKWKNILINIDISDNTISGLTGCDRDDLYSNTNSKLTAYNFITYLNNLYDKKGFTDYVNYIIIEENGDIKKYNFNNISNLSYYIKCEFPDMVTMKDIILSYTPIKLPKELIVNKTLDKINIDLSNLNYYNNIPIASYINTNKSLQKPMINYHSNQNITKRIIYRFSGFYMPIFYDIQLFDKDFFTNEVGNYKFDTTLTYFGIMKERKIRKVNHTNNVLKLSKSNTQKSIYPMLSEIGYSVIDFFIFKSTWDIGYHYITTNDEKTIESKKNKELSLKVSNVGILHPIQNINL